MAGCAISCSPTRVCDPPATFFTISSAEWRGLLTAGPVSRGAPIPRLSGHLYKSPFRCVDIIHQFPLLQTLQLLGRFSPCEKPTGFCPFLSFQPERASVRNPRSHGCSVVKPQSRSQLRVVKKHIWKSTNTSRFPCCNVQVFIERSKKKKPSHSDFVTELEYRTLIQEQKWHSSQVDFLAVWLKARLLKRKHHAHSNIKMNVCVC